MSDSRLKGELGFLGIGHEMPVHASSRYKPGSCAATSFVFHLNFAYFSNVLNVSASAS